MTSWTLVNANMIATHHPYTFYKPDTEAIDRVAAGESVKLIFTFDTGNPDAPHAEQPWVTAEGIEADGTFNGRLDNYPRYIRDLSLGKRAIFETRHIIDTEHDPRETPISHYARYCFMTRRVIDEGKAAGYLYREAPEEEDDNGRRLMADNESNDYMNTAETTAHVSLGSVLNADNSILPLLDTPPERTFERLTDGSFIEVQGSED